MLTSLTEGYIKKKDYIYIIYVRNIYIICVYLDNGLRHHMLDRSDFTR